MARWLRRLEISRRRDIDPTGATNRTIRRIVARYPGHMVHLDVKKVGRIPDGGGWRVHGRGSDQAKAVDRAKGARAGYVYLHSAVDGFSRLAYTEALPGETAATTTGFWARARAFFTVHGVTRITRVVTDNGSNYRAGDFTRAVLASATRHQHIRPRTPRTTARSNATTAPWPKSSSAPAHGPQRPNAPMRSSSRVASIPPTRERQRPRPPFFRHSPVAV